MIRSESTEMYLKTILELASGEEPVAISQVAERWGVTPVSANEMIKRLAEHGMILHEPYKGVSLTETGLRQATNILRRHRLWERLLVDHLGVDWAEAHDAACQLEHATAETVTAALDTFLGHPATCPHGNPIPDPNQPVTEAETQPLSTLEIGQPGTIVRIHPEETPLLTYLADHGIYPQLPVEVKEIAPLDGPLTIQVGERRTVIGREAASRVHVAVY
jgi:DtxR family Mn-dependent transcriptional regulator